MADGWVFVAYLEGGRVSHFMRTTSHREAWGYLKAAVRNRYREGGTIKCVVPVRKGAAGSFFVFPFRGQSEGLTIKPFSEFRDEQGA